MGSPSANRNVGSALLGAAFLMATSAIGPGFITQSTVLTEKLLTSFGFVILCSVVLDIVIQLNIWRIICVTGKSAQDLANEVTKGSGYLLSVLIALGGLAFNIGNIGGAALGMQVMFDTTITQGAWISLAISLIIFLSKEIGYALDWFTKILGLVMIGITIYIVIKSDPPVIQAVHHTFLPETIDTTAIIILVGGTVGGYISFAGAHRLLEAGVTGSHNVRKVSHAAVKGIVIASIMRILLFLAALGVVTAGNILTASNPAASVFKIAAGSFGYRIFGIVLWCAAITSIVGCAYTSVSFVSGYFRKIDKRVIIAVFIIVSAVILLLVGRPVNILVIVGAVNAFILPIALSLILIASRSRILINEYAHPRWLLVTGWIAVLLLSFMCFKAITTDLMPLWQE